MTERSRDPTRASAAAAAIDAIPVTTGHNQRFSRMRSFQACNRNTDATGRSVSISCRCGSKHVTIVARGYGASHDTNESWVRLDCVEPTTCSMSTMEP